MSKSIEELIEQLEAELDKAQEIADAAWEAADEAFQRSDEAQVAAKAQAKADEVRKKYEAALKGGAE